MMNCFFDNELNGIKCIPIIPILTDDFSKWFDHQEEYLKNWVKINNFSAKTATFCLIPDQKGNLEQVLLGRNSYDDFWSFGALPYGLNYDAIFQIAEPNFTDEQFFIASLIWGFGSYRFSRYKKNDNKIPKLFISRNHYKPIIQNIVQSIYLVRDLINTPAEDMTPAILAAHAEEVAKKYGANFKQFIGDELLQNNFSAIHTIGRASVNAPRLVELKWGDAKHKKITLVGKGVCFDSGGLDLKPASGMEAMKKDMAGAADVLGLAQMIMAANLPIHLTVILPLVENVVSGASYKPGDIITMRNGTTVEITNTDAEGRLILADALSYACEDKPDLLIDFATLTGAARIALGTDLPAMFSNTDGVSKQIIDSCREVSDEVWRLPLFEQYNEMLDSKIADMKNSPASSYGGAITAALFLQKFVAKGIDWVHFDIMGMNVKARPGRPEGGEAMSIRGVFKYLVDKYTP